MSSSNIDDVARWLDDVVKDFDFTLPGKDESVGKDAAMAVVEGIIDRSVPNAKAPDGSEWADNSDEPPGHYKTRKFKRYDADQPGILTGQMLSQQSLYGRTTITRDAVEMKYGTNEAATRARNGPADERDMQATDTQKGDWFTEGGRKFYELDDAINKAVIEGQGEALAEYIKERNVSGL